MNIYEQKEILLIWIKSCHTAEQLDLLTDIVTDFIVKRFLDKIEPLEMELVKAELSEAIIEQRVVAASERNSMRRKTHRQNIPNETYYFLSEKSQSSTTMKTQKRVFAP